jgi:hypothetical protein
MTVAIALQATAIAAQGVQAGQVGEPTMMPSWPHTEFGQREFPDRGRLHVAPRCAVPTRHRTSDPRPVVELRLAERLCRAPSPALSSKSAAKRVTRSAVSGFQPGVRSSLSTNTRLPSPSRTAHRRAASTM